MIVPDLTDKLSISFSQFTTCSQRIDLVDKSIDVFIQKVLGERRNIRKTLKNVLKNSSEEKYLNGTGHEASVAQIRKSTGARRAGKISESSTSQRSLSEMFSLFRAMKLAAGSVGVIEFLMENTENHPRTSMAASADSRIPVLL